MSDTRTKAQLVVAIDDTDNPEQGGTGRVAREIAQRLRARFPIWGVTRHQFAVLPGIPYTRNNSGNAIHVLAEAPDLGALTDEIGGWLRELCLPGSDPGLCIARPGALVGNGFGAAAQTRVLTKDEARAVAQTAGVILRNPCATDDGIIGALAGACLACGGNDGRFVEIGEMRPLSGRLTVSEVLAAGGDEVRSVEERPITEGVIAADRLRPALRGGKCVLYCRPGDDGLWAPIMGAPGDRSKEGRTDG